VARLKTCPQVVTGGASTGGQAIGRLAIGRLVEPARQRGGTQKACPPVPVLPPRRSPPAAPGSRGRLKTCPPVEVRFGPRPALPDAPGLGVDSGTGFLGGGTDGWRGCEEGPGAGTEDLSPCLEGPWGTGFWRSPSGGGGRESGRGSRSRQGDRLFGGGNAWVARPDARRGWGAETEARSPSSDRGGVYRGTGNWAVGNRAAGRTSQTTRGYPESLSPSTRLPPRRSPPAAPGSRGRLKTCPPVEVRFGPRPALPDAPGLGPRQRDRRQRDRLFGGGNRRVTRMRGAAGGAGKEDLSPSSVPRGGWPQQGDRLLGGCRLGEGAGSWGGHLVGVPNAVEFF
jgi:hypothetical protein